MTQKRQRYNGRPDYLKVDEATRIFALSPNTIRKLALECGALRKINKNVLIHYEKLSEYVETFEAFE